MINVLDYWLITWLLTSLTPIAIHYTSQYWNSSVLNQFLHPRCEKICIMQKEYSMVNSPYPWWAPLPMCALNKKGMSLSKQISHTQIYYRHSLRPFENQLQFIFSTRIFFGNLAQPADPYHKCQHVHQLRSAAQDVSPTVLCSDVFRNTRFIRRLEFWDIVENRWEFINPSVE